MSAERWEAPFVLDSDEVRYKAFGVDTRCNYTAKEHLPVRDDVWFDEFNEPNFFFLGDFNGQSNTTPRYFMQLLYSRHLHRKQ